MRFSFIFTRSLQSIPIVFLLSLYSYRHLLTRMIRHELKGRFAGTIGGMLWNLAHPLLIAFVYLFVFVYVFKLKLGITGSSEASVVYIIAGLFPWMIIAEGTSKGTTAPMENASLIKKSHFPVEVLLAKCVITPIFSHGIVLVILSVHAVFTNASLWLFTLLPVILVIQIFFTLGMVFFLATTAVFFRDIVEFVQILTTMGMFLTPIFYNVSMVPNWAKLALYFNPFYPFIYSYQSLFLNGIIDFRMLALAFGWTSLLFVLGAIFFNKFKSEFADWL